MLDSKSNDDAIVDQLAYKIIGKKIKSVVLIEDQGLVLGLLKVWIGQIEGIKVIAQFESNDHFIDWIESGRWLHEEAPIMVITDLMMPGKPSVDTIPWLRKKYPNIKILALTASNDPLLFQPIASYVDGIISKKNDAAKEFPRALRRIAVGEQYFSASIEETMRKNYESKPILNTLTEREISVMRRIFQGMPVKSIAEEDGVTSQSITVIRKRAKEKFGGRTEFEIYESFKAANLVQSTQK